MDLQSLQQQYPVFIYDSYAYELQGEKIVFTFSFQCGEHRFETEDTISGVTQEMVDRVGKELLDQFVFSLGLAEIASYWKAFCSPTIEIACGYLDEEQQKFWQKLFFHGMGEFFYQNQIPPFTPEIVSRGQRSEVRFLNDTDSLPLASMKPILIPVGGGKDSIVTLELLAEAGYPIYTWSGLKGSSPQVIDLFGKRHPRQGDIVFSRTLDSKLLELNRAGHPNGHTPFSSVLAFFTLLTAVLYEIPYIAVSNEGSSNEATGTWMGIDVNHQYSKSVAFETDFQRYVRHTFGDSAPLYFSFLRPLDELAIMHLFIQYPEYFDVFKSCNVGQHENVWCGTCAKCTFVALLLSAYVDDNVITRIFGKNMMTDSNLSDHIDALIGKVEFKPFECVGTRSESLRALQMAIARRKESLPALLELYKTYIPSHSVTSQHVRYESTMPEEFRKLIQERDPSTV